jgi:hypothetical protein
MIPRVTLLQLVDVVSQFAETESEVVAVVVDLVNGGKVELGGTFRGSKFTFDDVASPEA